MNKSMVFVVVLASVFSYSVFADDQQDVSVDIKTGNVSTIAIGEGANAEVNLGVVSSDNGDCTHIKIEHGDLKRLAIGKQARASIQLPANQNDCLGH